MKNIKQKNKGFTLIEVLVAAFIFAGAAVTAASIFAISSNTQISTEISRNLVEDTRFSLEEISREIRLASDEIKFCSDSRCSQLVQTPGQGGIYYGDYIKTKSGSTEKIFGIIPGSNTFGVNTGGIWQPLMTENYTMSKKEGLSYYFSGIPTPNIPSQIPVTKQPYVSIEMTVEYKNPAKESEKVTETIQTTITSRAYKTTIFNY